MTLLFDTKVEFLDSDAVGTIGSWHPREPIFAVASYSQERGGSVTVFGDTVRVFVTNTLRKHCLRTIVF